MYDEFRQPRSRQALPFTMTSNPRGCLSIPGKSGRELWRRGADGVCVKADDGAKPAGGVFIIEALALDSVPFWAVAPSDGKTDLHRVAALKREGLGINTEADGCAWTQWAVGQAENRMLIASAGLAQTPSPEMLEMLPEAFELSPRLYPIPRDEAALWTELGRHVIAFMRGGSLVHFATLSARTLDGEAAREVRDLMVALEANGLLAKLTGLRLWAEAGEEFVRELGDELALPVRNEDQPPPRLPRVACEIVPPEIARRRRTQASRARRVRLALTAASAYLAFFLSWGGWLLLREHKLASSTAALEQLRPAAEEVGTCASDGAA